VSMYMLGFTLVYIYIYIYLKASPLPPAPCQQATADWLPAEMGHFIPQTVILETLRLHFGYPE
jgi:hypothetical protein